MPKVLLTGGCVLTLGAKTPNFKQADVLIDGAVVADVGPGLRARDAEHIDASDTIVMPGFVDAHRHAWRSLFRNTGEDDGEHGDPNALVEHAHPDDVYAATLIGLLGAVEAGITTVVDWTPFGADADLANAALQAHADAGLRTVFVDGAGPSTGRVATLTAAAGPSTAIAAGTSLPLDVEAPAVPAAWSEARALGLRIHAHGGSEGLGRGAVSDLGARGLLGEDVTLIHCSALDEADVAAIASSGASICLVPSSQMAGGHGSPPIQQLIDHDVRPGLGVEDERVAPGDMFAQMRATISLQHATVFDLKLAGKAGVPKLMSTRDALRHATVGGARVAGFRGVTGSLEPGMQADVIVLRTDRPNIFPVNDPIGAVVWGMDTSNVDWVFVAGRPLMRGGALEADVEEVRTLATTAQRRIATAAGGRPVGAARGG